ncbi:MAG: hypothetical protein FJX72_01120, partial [Armatimonadetes bacterium]|nr:hypothetical protein [Armatimonadota bacterium]
MALGAAALLASAAVWACAVTAAGRVAAASRCAVAAASRCAASGNDPRHAGRVYRVTQRDGVWWYVSPDGKPVFSLGVCCVGP